MEKTQKIITFVIASLIICVIGAFVAVNWTGVSALLSGATIYTETQVKDSYQQGYDDANTNEDTLTDSLNYYKGLVEDDNTEISNLKNTISSLTSEKADNLAKIDSLTTDKEDLQSTVDSLTATNTANEETITAQTAKISTLQTKVDDLTTDCDAKAVTITELQSDILDLNDKITALEATGDDNTAEIAELRTELADKEAKLTTVTNSYNNAKSQIDSLNEYISNLATLNTQLQTTNESNATVIATLNTKIKSLNTQISELNETVSASSTTESSLRAKISQLETSISYYESYISALESDSQCVATFEFNGSVYAIQIVSTGSFLSISNPTGDDNVSFNYWTVNGNEVDLSTYMITTNTIFVANVTYSYDVTFISNEETVLNETITSGSYATVPTDPTFDGYTFDGWSLDGVTVVTVSDNAVTADVTYYAVFTQLFTVTFISGDDTVSTQSVRNGECPTDVTIADTTYKAFNGWTINDAAVDVGSYIITANTVFVADFTYSYDVTFVSNEVTVDSQVIESGSYATVPTDPMLDGYTFDGWSLDGETVITVSENAITSDVIYYAVFVLNDNFTAVSFSGLSSFVGDNVWTDGTDTYYAVGSSYYILDADTRTWTSISMTWKSSTAFSPNCVFNIGDNTYYIYGTTSYKFDSSSYSWTYFSLGINNNTEYYGYYVWTDGTNYYFSKGTKQFVFDEDTSKFVSMTWSGLTSFDGDDVWTDGTSYYCSDYVLDSDTSTWTSVTITCPFTLFEFIWTDGTNVFYSFSGHNYIFDSSSLTWNSITFTGLNTIRGSYMWTDGTNVYYSGSYSVASNYVFIY
jgi:uncharacterized repeat protein (TIGR02543 family)